MWELKIEKIENGYLLSHDEEWEEGKFGTVKEVIEEGGDEKETMSRLLYQVSEYFGFHHNKYAKDNLRISWDKKGRGVE